MINKSKFTTCAMVVVRCVLIAKGRVRNQMKKKMYETKCHIFSLSADLCFIYLYKSNAKHKSKSVVVYRRNKM